MGRYTLFVSPGIRSMDAADARARYEGEGEKSDYLDADRIRDVARDLVGVEGLVILPPDEDEEPGSPHGICLEVEGDDASPDVCVDGWGVSISISTAADEDGTARSIDGALSIAGTASRLLDADVYEVDGDRVVDLELGRKEIVRAAREAMVRDDPRAPAASGKSGRALMVLFLVLPMALLFLLRRRLSGIVLFFLFLGTSAAIGVFATWWLQRSRPLAPGPTPLAPPLQPTSKTEFDDRPIGPS